MNTVRVAVLDSGIAKEITNSKIVYKKQFYWDYLEETIKSNSNVIDYNGHGSACIETILNICPDAEIYVIKILGISGRTSGKVLLEALRFANELNVHIIVLAASIVGIKDYSSIRDLCRTIKNNNKILIAAVQNGKDNSIIANDKNVIGVIGRENFSYPFSFQANSEIQMVCDSSPIFIYGRKGIRQLFKGNSKATALAAGYIANYLLNNNISAGEIEKYMDRESKKINKKGKENRIESSMKSFSVEQERYYAENDERYQAFIYLLCECLNCADVAKIRNSNLLAHENGVWIKDIDAFLDLINERLKVEVKEFQADDLMWAYQFYEKYLRNYGTDGGVKK